MASTFALSGETSCNADAIPAGNPAVAWYPQGMMHKLPVFLASLSLLVSPTVTAQYRQVTRPPAHSGILAAFLPEERIHAFFFRSGTHGLCVLDEGVPRRFGSLRQAVNASGCMAGVNGGYFAADPQSSPLGLVIHRGRQISPLATRGFTVSGVLYDTGNGIFLERSRNLTHAPKHMQEAIQGGPFLIEKGNIVKGLNNTRRASRTFVATDGRGQWCIGVCSSMTLHELACWLRQGALAPFRISTALNLDGGSSSAFLDTGSGVSLPASKPVRNYVGIKQRTRTPEHRAANN